MDDDLSNQPYVFCPHSADGRIAIVLVKTVCRPWPMSHHHDVLWSRTFSTTARRNRYYDLIWACRGTGIWSIWASIAATRGPVALDAVLDPIVRAARAGEPGSDEFWPEGPSRGLHFEEPARFARYNVRRNLDGLGLRIVDELADGGAATLWHRRFDSWSDRERVARWLRTHIADLPRLARLLADEGTAPFEGAMCVHMTGYRQILERSAKKSLDEPD